MAKMRAVQVSRAGGPLEVVGRDVPDPGRGEVRIRVQACGICHSDAITKDGGFPGLAYPRVPGHEVVGVIDARTSRGSLSASASASAGTAAGADAAIRAVAATSSLVEPPRGSPASPATAATRST